MATPKATSANQARALRLAIATTRPGHPRRSSATEALCGLGARLRRLDLSIAWWGIRHETLDERPRRVRDLVHGACKHRFVGFRRPGEAAQLSDELQRRGSNLIVRGRRSEVVQRFDASTHGASPLSPQRAAESG